MKVLYFAWLRERIGKGEEILDLPTSVTTIAELIEFLSQKGEEYAYAFESRATIRAAINQTHVKASASLAGAQEVAFFPPMTGG